MNFYRCLICGDVYMGTELPTNCPFCGAPARKYMVDTKDWVDENESIGGLSDVSRRNLKAALQLEVNNAPFYREASKKSGNIELQGIFKCLAKIEAEHAAVIKKILKCELPPPQEGKEVAAESDIENLKAAHKREISATAFYEKAAGESVEPRVKKVFTALSEIETDHIGLEDQLIRKYE